MTHVDWAHIHLSCMTCVVSGFFFCKVCRVAGTVAHRIAEWSTMIPLIRLYTASGYFLQKKKGAHRQQADSIDTYDVTHLAFNRSNKSVAWALLPAPNSARTIASQVDGSL